MTGVVLDMPTTAVGELAERHRRPALRMRGGVLLAGDLVAAGLALFAAGAVGRPIVEPAGGALLLLVWAVCLMTAGAIVHHERGADGPRAVLRAGCSLALAATAVSLAAPGLLSGGQAFGLAATWVLASVVVRGVQSWADEATPLVPLVVVGGGESSGPAVAALERRLGSAVPVVRLADDSEPSFADHGQVRLEEVADFARRAGVGAVVAIPAEGLDAARLRRLQWELEATSTPLYVDAGLPEAAPNRLRPARLGGLTVVRVDAGPRLGAGWVMIGLTGRVAAAIGLVLLLPLLLVIGLAVRRTSAGPAIYRQRRIGEDGRAFTMFKFRTMVVAPCEVELQNNCDDVLFKMRDDPRVTPLGRWLRRYSLDELPQLVNVVLGQMRLVGPRPALPQEVSVYGEDARRRLAVSPGITGLWQVSGRSDLTWEETVRLDLHYVDNWTPWLDLRILVRTLGAVVGHRGAY